MAFQDTDNKAAVRQKWNLPILSSYANELGRKLAYFGLPGAEIRDLIDWKDVLDYRTGVELLSKAGKGRSQELRTIDQIQLNVMMNGLGSDWQLLRGYVEDIILEGFDIDGTPPALNNRDVPHRRLFRYDLYNLDFIGGIGYADTKGESKRIRTIRKLFERQKGHDFLLLLTINVRDTVGKELSGYLLEISEENPDDGDIRIMLEWYAAAGRGMKKYKLKSALPIAIQDFARFCSFHCLCYPPLAYRGHNATMVHFVFRFEYTPGRNFPLPRQQGIKDLLNLPLVEIDNANVILAEVQHPEFDFSRCLRCFSFVPEEARVELLPSSLVEFEPTSA
jgi:hypothetical protein